MWNEPRHEISNNLICATSKATDQPAHMRSLIRAFASRLNILWVLSYWLNIILKGGCKGSSESIHAKMPHCWKSHVAAEIYMYIFEPVFHISFKLFPCWWRQNTATVCVQTFCKGKTPHQQIKSSHDFIWATSRANLSTGFPTKLVSYQSPWLPWLARKLNFTYSKFTYDTCQKANNKRADQTAWMRRLVCAFDVPKYRRQVFSPRGPSFMVWV